MRGSAKGLLLLLILAVPVHAEVSLVPITWHPDDGIDPLGWSDNGADPFSARYVQAPFAYPYVVVDGVTRFDGLANDTHATYASLVDSRRAVAAPVELVVAVEDTAPLVVHVQVVGRHASLGDLRLHGVVLEDPVHLRPLVTNGVFDHRFTARAWQTIELPGPEGGHVPARTHDVELSLPRPEGDALVAVFVTVAEARPLSLWSAGEVVQATLVEPGTTMHQRARGVLFEMLSATWCDPCLIGDAALERLALEAGVAEPLRAAGPTYFRGVPWLALAAGAVVFLWGVRR